MNLANPKTYIKRRSFFAAIPALAATATGAMAFKAPDAPANDLPDFWKRIISSATDVFESGVPHAGAGDRYTVVSKAKLDDLQGAIEALLAA